MQYAKCTNKLYKLPKQTIIHFKNNFTLKNIIINFIIKNPLLINNTLIPDDLTNIILNSKSIFYICCEYGVCWIMKSMYLMSKIGL